MYTNESTSKISLRDVILQFLFVALFISILLWLFPMKGDFKKLENSVDKLSDSSLELSKDATGELNLAVLFDRIFNENVVAMKDAAKSYYTTSRLPQKVGETTKMTLKEMLSKKIILPFVDKNGKTCDTDASYVQITKYKDEYVMKVNLKCSDQENYLLVYMGCYDYCKTTICEKNKTDVKKPVVHPVAPKKLSSPTCSLTVESGKLGTNGAYISDVVVKFKSKNAGKDATLTGYGLGLSKNYNKANTYKVTKLGKTVVYGYVKNSNGKTAKCSITIKKAEEPKPEVKPEIKAPTCSLQVISGTKGNNNWYTSDVVIGFASKEANTKGASIVAYGLGTSENYNNNNDYRINSDGTVTIYGYVKDSNNQVANCNITVKRDATKPICTLGVGKGTLASDSQYISDVLMGFKTMDDATSGIATYGLGLSKNYDKANTYTLSGVGSHTLYGYVKDNAGNEATCSRNISIRNPLTTTTTCSWSDWSDWSTTAYEASDSKEVRYRTILKGYNVKKIKDTTKPIFTTKQVYVGNTTTKVCSKYSYTGEITYSAWNYKGRFVTSSSSLSDTDSVKYVLVGTDDYYCNSSGSCGAGTFYVWDLYEKGVATTTGTYSCSNYTAVTTAVSANKTILTGYETKEEKTPVYEKQYSYRTKTCTTVTK